MQNRVSAIKIKFCQYSDWTKQTTVTYDAGPQQHPGDWGSEIMCPKHEFINQVSASFGTAHGVDAGFNGLKVKCQSLSSQASS